MAYKHERYFTSLKIKLHIITSFFKGSLWVWLSKDLFIFGCTESSLLLQAFSSGRRGYSLVFV